MRRAGLRGVCRHGHVVIARRKQRDRPASDPVNRGLMAAAPNRPCATDMTCVPTRAGFVYAAIVLAVWSWPIVGRSIGGRMSARWVLAAAAMAVQQRKPDRVIHCCDRDSPYTRLPSARAARGWVSGRRWAASPWPMLMRWPTALRPAWGTNCPTGAVSGARPKRGRRRLAGSRAGTKRAGSTRLCTAGSRSNSRREESRKRKSETTTAAADGLLTGSLSVACASSPVDDPALPFPGNRLRTGPEACRATRVGAADELRSVVRAQGLRGAVRRCKAFMIDMESVAPLLRRARGRRTVRGPGDAMIGDVVVVPPVSKPVELARTARQGGAQGWFRPTGSTII